MRARAPQLQRSAIAAAMLFVLSALAPGQAALPQAGVASRSEQNAATVETVVSRMTEAQYNNRHAIRPYMVTREYKLFDEKSKAADSEVLAEVSFVPPASKQYQITETSGSGRGEKVVRKVLDHEQQMAGDWEDTALTARNYSFELLGREKIGDRDCFVLAVTPKRESKDLIRGKAWIDSQTYNPLQVVGELAKNPSFWVKHVELTLRFGDVDGMWLQTSATANADVRIFGKHVLTSRDVQYDTGSVQASARGKVRRRTLPTENLGSAILFQR